MGGWLLACERKGRQRLGCLHMVGWLDYESDDQRGTVLILSLVKNNDLPIYYREGVTFYAKNDNCI